MGDTQTDTDSETRLTDGTAPQRAGQSHRTERADWNDDRRRSTGVV
ncbi:hypothetical protein [Natronorubrum sp. DTA28]